MRRFEYTDAKSNKFWEIEVEGSSYTTRHGRIGTTGRATTKSFASAVMADKQAESAIAAKLRKGYVELTPESQQAKVEAAEVDAGHDLGPLAKLERSLIQNLDDLDSWSVYGDALAEAGNPRGELVALYVARARGTIDPKPFRAQERQLLHANAAAWFGKFVSDDGWRECFGWTHQMGFWGRIRLWVDYDHDGTDVAKALAYALAHPSAKFLRELDLGLVSADGSCDYSGCVRALVKHGPLPSLRRLHIGDFAFPEESEISWVHVGRVGDLWPLLTGLEQLTLQGASIELGVVRSDSLRRLELLTGGLPRGAGEALTRAQLPALEQLVVWFGTTDYGGSCSAEQVRGILENPSFTRLRSLGLQDADFADDIAQEVARGTLPATLTTLDLSMGTMSDAGAEALLSRVDMLAPLELLDLRSNFLSPEMAARVQAALRNARVDDQRSGDHYVSVGE